MTALTTTSLALFVSWEEGMVKKGRLRLVDRALDGEGVSLHIMVKVRCWERPVQ